MKTYRVRISDGKRTVEKEVTASRDSLNAAIDRMFRNKKHREELVRTFLIGEATIDVIDTDTYEVVGDGKFTTNVFAGRSEYSVKLY